MDVAFLGTGIMGLPMARNCARAGLGVRAWNRTPEKARPLEADGVTVCASAQDAVDGADVVVTILSAVDAVLDSLPERLPDAAVWLQMSTVGVEGIERCAALAAERGVPLVDAPVLGTKAPAEAGKLTVLAAGPEDAVERCVPIFDAVGQKTVRAGEEPGGATRLKLVLNHWVLTLVEGTAQTIQLAEELGVDPRRWLEGIEGGPLDSVYAQTKGQAILDRSLDPAFRLALAHKDARLILDAAEDAPLMAVVAERMARAIDAGHGDEDMAATYFGR